MGAGASQPKAPTKSVEPIKVSAGGATRQTKPVRPSTALRETSRQRLHVPLARWWVQGQRCPPQHQGSEGGGMVASGYEASHPSRDYVLWPAPASKPFLTGTGYNRAWAALGQPASVTPLQT